MKKTISKGYFGSIRDIFIPKSFKIKAVSIALISVILFSYLPYFSGSGLSAAKVMAPYSNGIFPGSIDTNLDATYRVAFPNITFFYPIAFRPVPNQSTNVVGQLNGLIYWFSDDETTMDKNLLLDLSADVGLVSDGGFLGMAIHPDFDDPTNPKNYFYVYYATKNAQGQDSPPFGGYTNQGCSYGDAEYQGNYLVLERFEVDPSTMTFVSNSRTTLLKNRMYGTTHYGGGLEFGDDGFLYLTTGDMASWRRSQEITEDLAGGVLRLDVDKDATKSHAPLRTKPNDTGFAGEISGVEYWIPNDNPFSDTTPGSTTNLYGQPKLTTTNPNDVWVVGDFFEEYYAIGLRNPFRMTKDSQTGTMYIGDVGLNSREEINVLSANANFGWPLYEGNINGPGCYSDLFNDMNQTGPLTEFPHGIANSITGGYVYRGTGIPELFGKYICADYGGGNEIFSIDIGSGAYDQISSLSVTGVQGVIGFGQADDGELFLLGLGQNTTLFKLIDDDVDYGSAPILLSQTGIFSNLSTLDVVDGYVPYELYESFWSDGALKKRWIAVPNNDGVHSGTNEQIKYSEYGDWEFPSGTVIVKHFDLMVDDNNPSVTKKVETRVSVVDENGEMYYLTYNWNETETDAILQGSALDEDVTITTVGGGTRTQTWHFPSNSDCINCHNEANKGGLGLKARFLNTDYTYAETGITANQLVTLSHLGIIDTSITDADTEDILTNKRQDDPNATLDEKARSYLDNNCAYCHRRDNSIRTIFDLRYFNSLEATSLLTSGILTPLNIAPDEEIVYPGDATKSILFHRMNSVNEAVMMPPISKTIIDQSAVNLVEQWINQLDPSQALAEDNNPNPTSNLALLSSAQLSGYIGPGNGRGNPIDILYDPSIQDYKVITQFAEYGLPYSGSGNNLGTVDADNGMRWQVDWPEPKFVNYITFGGSYPNQPQPNTMWRVSYLRDGTWHTIEEGQGGWINNSSGQAYGNTAIYVWDGSNQAPVYAEAVRLQLYSDGTHDLYRVHLRGRGGNTQFSNGQDLGTEPKASLVQFLPHGAETSIDNIVLGNQTGCDPETNTYTQELVVSYTNPPATGTIEVNGQFFPITASPQTIVLTDLVSDGLDVEVTAEFTDGYQTLYRTDGGLFTAPAECDDIVIGVDESMTINGDFTVSNDGSIEIMEGGSLTVDGNLTINGDVTLHSVSNKYSSLIVTGATTGEISYERHVNAFNGSTGNDLVSSPVGGEIFGDFAALNPNIFENPNNTQQKLFGPFNENTGSYGIYSTSTNANTNIESGKGYRAARDSSEDGISGTTFTFKGNIVTANVDVNITQSGNAFDGWNLIGNPYTSYIDFNAFFALNKDQLDIGTYKSIYGYDGDASNGWTVWNQAVIDEGSITELVAPGQGFFVKSKTGGGLVTFTPAMRVAGVSDDFIQGRSSSSAHQGYLRLKLDSNEDSHSTEFYFNTNATLGLDPGYDASFFNGSIPAFSVYSHLVENNPNVAFAIQTLGAEDINNVRIPLGVHANQGQNISLSIEETDIPETIYVYLEDTYNNTYTLLNQSNYTTTTQSDLSGVGRFYLNFQSQSLSTTQNSLDEISIYSDAASKTIVIKGFISEDMSLTLYDIHGRNVINDIVNSGKSRHQINVDHLSAGVYIVELVSKSNNKRIEKLIIR